MVAMFVNRTRQMSNLYKESSVLPTKFRFIWPSGFRGEDSNVKSKQTMDTK